MKSFSPIVSLLTVLQLIATIRVSHAFTVTLTPISILSTDSNQVRRFGTLSTLRLSSNDSDEEAQAPYLALEQIMRLRGKVDTGYGRGGKKLGFPTANLPSSLFKDALKDVPMGVYFGWAVVEHVQHDGGGEEVEVKKGRNVTHKAVVNVGYSPTFDGEENREKIVEAHLIVEQGDIEGDFYNEPMRLALSGFLRPEMKFPSFPDLIEAINKDVVNAKNALDLDPFKSLQDDSFVSNPSAEWIGTSGGDEIASYEFEDM